MGLTNAYRDHIAANTIGESVTVFNNANARIGVGDGTAAFSASQTDLQGTNKFRKGMDAGYPTRSGNVLTFQSTFGASEANFEWQEWGVFNAASAGTMLNRFVQNLGTKTSSQTFRLTVQITLNV
jgi:hypothetical protein